MAVNDLVTIQQATAYINDVAISDAAMIQSILDAASQAVIDILQYDPTQQEYTEVLNGTGGLSIFPKAMPIQGVASVSINQALSAASAGCYVLDGFMGSSNQSLPQPQATVVDISTISFDDYSIFYLTGACWPRGRRNITAVYTAGYDVIPGPIQQATLYTLQAMWNAQRIDPNATGENQEGIVAASFWQTGPGSVPPQARSLLIPYMNRFKV